MKRILISLLAIGALQAEDVLTVDPAGAVIVAGAVPVAPTSTQVRIGGGRVATGLAFDSYLNGLMQGTWAADALGPFIQWRQAGKTFSVYDEVGGRQLVVTKSPPTTVTAGQVVIGGGFIWAGASQLNMRPSSDVPIEIVNRQTNGGIDLYPDGVVRAVRVTKTNTSFSTPINVAGTVTAGDVVINRTAPATGAQAVRGDEKGAANGLATLDASGKVLASQLPLMVSSKGVQFFTSSGTFTVPAGVTQIQVIALGGGSGGVPSQTSSNQDGSYATLAEPGNAGGFAWAVVSSPQGSYAITVGTGGGIGGLAGSQTSFGSLIICSGATYLNGGAAVLNGATGLAIQGAKGTNSQPVSLNGNFYGYAPGTAGAGYMFGSPGAGYGSGGNPDGPGRPGLVVVMW